MTASLSEVYRERYTYIILKFSITSTVIIVWCRSRHLPHVSVFFYCYLPNCPLAMYSWMLNGHLATSQDKRHKDIENIASLTKISQCSNSTIKGV